MTALLDLHPDQLAERLRREAGRAFLVHDPAGARPRVSAPWLHELADFLEQDRRDHRAHEAVFFAAGPATGALFAAFVHWTDRGQAAGGVRHWPYPRLENLVRDGLRLSVGMTRKNALAGLWWGGGKGIIARRDGDAWRDPGHRRTLYREYGEFISSLCGCYVTAEDAGTTPTDMAHVFARTRHTTCIPPEHGGSGNPSAPTARGVVCAMEGALDHLGVGDLEGKTVAMQGAGNVAGFMIGELLARGVGRIEATDISAERIDELRARHDDARLHLRVVGPEDVSIFECPCDVFAPNALGGTLNPDTIPRLRAKIVCGAANNQLLDDRRDDAAIAARGIVYVPDFLANRMGIVNCANEQYGHLDDDPAIARHFGREWENSIYVIARRVLERAERDGVTPARAANDLADELARRPHPIWPGRARAIIEELAGAGVAPG